MATFTHLYEREALVTLVFRCGPCRRAFAAGTPAELLDGILETADREGGDTLQVRAPYCRTAGASVWHDVVESLSADPEEIDQRAGEYLTAGMLRWVQAGGKI